MEGAAAPKRGSARDRVPVIQRRRCLRSDSHPREFVNPSTDEWRCSMRSGRFHPCSCSYYSMMRYGARERTPVPDPYHPFVWQRVPAQRYGALGCPNGCLLTEMARSVVHQRTWRRTCLLAATVPFWQSVGGTSRTYAVLSEDARRFITAF